ncbi:MAG: hypothetical protein KHX03_01210 [Clostridium sp.]|nr:hypothetical protein [Clostridium sp.]
MNVKSVSLLNNASKVSFAQDSEKKETSKTPQYENPISRKKEKALATLSVIGGSVVLGAVVAGLSTCLKLGAKKSAMIGGVAAIIAAAFTLPSKLYNTTVNAFAREKEMNVYSRDKELKSSLTEEVHKEVLDPEVSLDKKLDDNLKLQMGNRAQGLYIQH